ncbi:phosphoribosylamine--glycine ligase [bacterium]|nr:phosphoribosylamine--glycine ligase [bacterium]MCI0603603.1 phosphoribosylamine--glycine ligase [bacterium]
MRILVIGYGGREHALVWKLKQSSNITEMFCAAGNPGIAESASVVDIDAANIVELAEFASDVKIDLTVVGPEIALDLGVVDEFQKRDLRIFGPTNSAAELESSKVFAKEFMSQRGIPTAHFRIANSAEEAERIVKSGEFRFPVVVKADGLASGKGVLVCHDERQVRDAVETIMLHRKFGKSGDRIVIEEFLEGEEISFHVISDGKKVLPLAASQDHKRLLDGDQGPNTGGMGAYSPTIAINKNIHRKIMNEIILPTISGMAEEGRLYQGVLYAGLMLTKDGPRVLEFNSRFGDPETQALLTRIDCDLAEVLMLACQGRLDEARVEWKKEASICVVLCSKGYPDNVESGHEITGIEDARATENVLVFHAGTALRDGKVVSSGGRVLGVTATAHNLSSAYDLVYSAVSKIHFNGMHYRKDIAKKALEHFKH